MSDLGQTIEDTRCGRLDPCQEVERLLERIKKYDGALRAWVTVDPEGARRQAAAVTAAVRDGRDPGPLSGTVWGVKDIIDVQGQPTRCGSAARSAAPPAAADAPVVQWLRQSGAIVLGKTACTEFACFDPCDTANPWNPACTPGGSSSGSAAAVAAGQCHAAWGSQTGGSILRPAAFCGVAGVKPRYGAWPTQGVSPVSRLLDHLGPLAPRVRDLAAIWSAWIARPAPPAKRPAVITVVRSWWDHAARPAQWDALERLQRAGAAIQSLQGAWDWDHLRAMHRRIMAYEAAIWHRALWNDRAEQLGPKFRQLIEEGMALGPQEFLEAAACQHAFSWQLRELAEQAPLLLTPGAQGPAPRSRATTGDPGFHSLWSLSGSCAVALPCGLDQGLPVGLQLVATAGSELQCLAWAMWCEQQLLPPAGPDLAWCAAA